MYSLQYHCNANHNVLSDVHGEKKVFTSVSFSLLLADVKFTLYLNKNKKHEKISDPCDHETLQNSSFSTVCQRISRYHVPIFLCHGTFYAQLWQNDFRAPGHSQLAYTVRICVIKFGPGVTKWCLNSTLKKRRRWLKCISSLDSHYHKSCRNIYVQFSHLISCSSVIKYASTYDILH